MDVFIGLTACLYFAGAVLGYLKGQGSEQFSDQIRHKIITAAFLWHTLLILWPIWQFRNYPFVTLPFERIVIAWAIVLLYFLWTKKYNFLILELYILFSSFILLFPVSLMPKLNPEIISTLWLSGGGIIKHIFIVGTISLMINILVLDLALLTDDEEDEKEKKEKKLLKYYYIGFGFWILALGSNYYWLSYVNAKALSTIETFSSLWAIALTLFMLINLYIRVVKNPTTVNPAKLIKTVISFMVVTLFAVAFGM